MGLGEDIRHVARSLEENGIPHCIMDVGLGRGFSQGDGSVTQKITTQPLYAFNLYCQNGWETRKYLAGRGAGLNKGRYAIGLWPWELPEWPTRWLRAYECVDEIWGISSFAAKAYHAFSGPVHPMGIPVSVGEIASRNRTDFGLPSQSYLYHYSFDLHSKIARKNPFGLIHAFQKAFPPGEGDDVGLVLKVNHAKLLRADTLKLRWIASRDPRIHLLEKSLRRPEVLALIRACDCYVSLHRSEGFGRGIAEALLLGKQVIATGWSGNIDFCKEPRVALVRHRKVSVKHGEYFHGEGQQWADPDLDHAAELMREIRQNPRDVAVGQPDLSPATVGARYARRLHEIWEVFEDKKKKITMDQLAGH
jgi:glycosyltransferase involved in cell wall biosynthesis